MGVTMKSGPREPMIHLSSRTAEELMTPNPASIRETMGVQDAIAFLLDKRITGAPVIDEAGRPVGVVTQTDILHHLRIRGRQNEPTEDEARGPRGWEGFQLEQVDRTQVRDLMTPAVFAVGLDAHPKKIVNEMCAMRVHRVFVVDRSGILVGVISALDVLRDLDEG